MQEEVSAGTGDISPGWVSLEELAARNRTATIIDDLVELAAADGEDKKGEQDQEEGLLLQQEDHDDELHAVLAAVEQAENRERDTTMHRLGIAWREADVLVQQGVCYAAVEVR